MELVLPDWHRGAECGEVFGLLPFRIGTRFAQ